MTSVTPWPEITMRGCLECGRVVALPAAKVDGFSHYCEPRKDFVFGGLVAVAYVPAAPASEEQ